MGAYRDQLLRETYGNQSFRLPSQEAEEPSGTLTILQCNGRADCGSSNRRRSLHTVVGTGTLTQRHFGGT